MYRMTRKPSDEFSAPANDPCRSFPIHSAKVSDASFVWTFCLRHEMIAFWLASMRVRGQRQEWRCNRPCYESGCDNRRKVCENFSVLQKHFHSIALFVVRRFIKSTNRYCASLCAVRQVVTSIKLINRPKVAWNFQAAAINQIYIIY